MNNQISNLNNLYLQQFNKTNDELKNQNVKLIENEIKLNEQEKTLINLTNSNKIQREILHEYDILLNVQQYKLMNCLENVKGFYKEANELKNNLIEEDKKINQLAFKNENEINEVRKQCKEGLEKINEITNVLNKNTESLTIQSTLIAKVQAISYKNAEKIDKLCEKLFNYESRMKILESKVDKIEEILKRHEEAILDLTKDVSDMKIQMEGVLKRIKEIENRVEKLETSQIQNHADKIIDYLDKMNEDGIYEFANFILEIRKMGKPFKLEHIMKGAKLIIEKNPRK